MVFSVPIWFIIVGHFSALRSVTFGSKDSGWKYRSNNWKSTILQENIGPVKTSNTFINNRRRRNTTNISIESPHRALQSKDFELRKQNVNLNSHLMCYKGGSFIKQKNCDIWHIANLFCFHLLSLTGYSPLYISTKFNKVYIIRLPLVLLTIKTDSNKIINSYFSYDWLTCYNFLFLLLFSC